jgi:hypothetical protein
LVELRERCDAVEQKLSRRAGEVEELEQLLEHARREVLDSRAATTAAVQDAVTLQCAALEAKLAQREVEVGQLEQALEVARREVLDSRAALQATLEEADLSRANETSCRVEADVARQAAAEAIAQASIAQAEAAASREALAASAADSLESKAAATNRLYALEEELVQSENGRLSEIEMRHDLERQLEAVISSL